MTTFNFTHAAEVDSSLVTGAWYNENDKTLVLDLNGWVYQYSDVARDTYEQLVESPSAGRYYAQNIKGKHKSKFAGYDYQVSLKKTEGTSFDTFAQSVVSTVVTPNKLREDNGVPPVGSTADTHFDLSVSNNVQALTKFTVYFTVNDGNNVKSHTVNNINVDGAVKSLSEIADALDVNVKVKGVYVHFE